MKGYRAWRQFHQYGRCYDSRRNRCRGSSEFELRSSKSFL